MKNTLGIGCWAFNEAQKYDFNDVELIDKAYGAVFSTENGRIMLAHLILTEEMFRPSFNENNSNEAAIFRDGRKAIVNDILARIFNNDIRFVIENFEKEENNEPT